MKFAGLLEAGRIDGVLTESKWVKGTYIAVNSITERSKIPRGVLTAGTKCYVNVGDSKNPAGEYRWNGDSWDYIGSGITYADLEEDNWHIYGRRKIDGKNAQWVQIDSTYLSELVTGKFKEKLDSLYAEREALDTAIGRLESLATQVATAENNSNSALDTANSANQAVAEVNNRLNTGDFTISLATEKKVGGIKADNNSSSESKGEFTRYYVGVQEDNDGGRAYVDIKPGEAIIDEESLKTALTKNENEVIKSTIWPTIESKIEEDDWIISGGTAEKLSAAD